MKSWSLKIMIFGIPKRKFYHFSNTFMLWNQFMMVTIAIYIKFLDNSIDYTNYSSTWKSFIFSTFMNKILKFLVIYYPLFLIYILFHYYLFNYSIILTFFFKNAENPIRRYHFQIRQNHCVGTCISHVKYTFYHRDETNKCTYIFVYRIFAITHRTFAITQFLRSYTTVAVRKIHGKIHSISFLHYTFQRDVETPKKQISHESLRKQYFLMVKYHLMILYLLD